MPYCRYFPGPCFPGRSAQRGLALVTVLWVLVLLSLIAASFTKTTRTEINLARNLIDNAQAEALAEAGVYWAVLGLLSPQSEGAENLLKLSGENPAVTRGGGEQELRRELQTGNLAPGADEMFREGWRTDGTAYVWTFGGREVRVAIQDEGGKIDMNAAPDELLHGLFTSTTWTDADGEVVGLDDEAADALVDAIRDFADADDLVRLNGAEDRDYDAAGLPWGAKDAPFAAVEELQQVLGVTPDIYQAVAAALTVYSGSKGIDAQTAPRRALLALPRSGAENVDAYLTLRAEAPEGAGPAFLEAEGFSARSRGRVYTIHAEGRTQNGAIFAREAVVRLGGEGGFTFAAWKQARRQLFPVGAAGEQP